MSNNKKEQKNSVLDAKLKAILNDTAWQRGLTWRNQKINAVAEARRRGITEEEIFKQLKIAGLIDATAKAIMRDAKYLEDSETTEATSKNEFEQGMHPCWNCGKVIPNNMNFCSEVCAKEYSSKKKKVK